MVKYNAHLGESVEHTSRPRLVTMNSPEMPAGTIRPETLAKAILPNYLISQTVAAELIVAASPEAVQ